MVLTNCYREHHPDHTVEYEGFAPPAVVGCYVTKFALHQAFEFIAGCILTFDEWVVLHCVELKRSRVGLEMQVRDSCRC